MNRILSFFIIIFIVGCEDQIVDECDTNNMTKEKITFSWIQENVFTPRCAVAGCHAGSNAAQNLNLSRDQAYAQLDSVASEQVPALLRIDPGNSSDSYLIIKLEGSDDRIQGGRMPQGSELNQVTIDSIKVWIDRGALEN